LDCDSNADLAFLDCAFRSHALPQVELRSVDIGERINLGRFLTLGMMSGENAQTWMYFRTCTYARLINCTLQHAANGPINSPPSLQQR